MTPSKLAPGLGTLLVSIEADEQALTMLVNSDGLPFKNWYAGSTTTRREYEAIIRAGYPVDPQAAALQAPRWEGHMGYAEQQAAIAGAYARRARAVARELLAGRGVKSTENNAEGRTWRQAEEADRWAAIAHTFGEWCWQVRGTEKAAGGPRGPGR